MWRGLREARRRNGECEMGVQGGRMRELGVVCVVDAADGGALPRPKQSFDKRRAASCVLLVCGMALEDAQSECL